MKTNLLKAIMVFTILVITSLNVKAQVTIGSLNAPEKGMLLELKNQVATADNETVDANGGGLGFPRVKLESRTTLEPFIANDPDFQNNKDKVKDLHTGTVVYNLYETPLPTNLSPDEVFTEGLYVWDGSRWERLGENNSGSKKFFYMPSFLIELTKTGDGNFNLYEEYERQFTKSIYNDTFVSSSIDPGFTNVPTHESGRLYHANELEFVVTYYDKSIMFIDRIDPDGEMWYRIDNLNLTVKSYINVVLVVK